MDETSKDRTGLDIAMLGHKRMPSREGGIEIVVEELCIRMAQLGNHVTCYNRSGHHISGKRYGKKIPKRYKGVNIEKVFTINKKGIAAMTASISASIRAALSDHDIVHFHAEGPSLMCWFPRLFGKKIVVTIHGLDHKRDKWGRMASAYLMLGEKMAVRYADCIIVLSEDTRRYFERTYGRQTEFIPNGVERPIRKGVNLIRDQFGLEGNDYILFLGRIVPEKGLQYLVRAFKKVGTTKRLVIAGGASDTEPFMRDLQILAGEDRRIIFTGFVQGEMMSELYSNAYIYVLPSDLEGMPLSLLEAMSYGNCCLVSDISECADVVGSRGVTFEKGNIDDLSKKIQFLCDDPSTVRRYKNTSADFICRKYDWDDIVHKTLDLYKRIL